MKAITFALALAGAAVAQPLEAQVVPPAPTPPGRVVPAPPAPAGGLPAGEVIPEWRARWELAQALSYLQRYSESLKEYRRVLAGRPKDAAIRQEYGQVLLWSGDAAGAAAELAAVPEADRSPAASLALGDALVSEHRESEAEGIYRAILRRDPSDQATRFKLAEILGRTKRYPESLDQYRIILAARPDDVQVRRHFAEVLLWSGQMAASATELRRTLPE